MKKQIIIIIIFGFLITFLIYKKTYHEEMNIVALGDSLALGLTAYNVKGYSFNDYLRDYYEDNSILKDYITEFCEINETSKTLLNKLENNETLESVDLSIQQAIFKAKIITIALGMDELNIINSINSKTIDNYLQNMQKIIKLLRNYNQKEIILLSLYESPKINNDQITKINNELQQIANQNNLKFINITSMPNQFYFTPKNYYINYKGHKYITNLIINNLT